MSRLISLLAILAVATVSGCNPPSSARFEEESGKPHSLPELLHWHDVAVSQQGRDLYFLKPIGAFGRQGVWASLKHIEAKGEAVSSYNNIELVFGVASEAKASTGDDICKDMPTLTRMWAMEQAAGAPAYQRSILADLVRSLCKSAEKPKF
jgi:hypothetical protein